MSPKDQEKLFHKEYASELIRIAESDLESANVLKSSAKGRAENVCFHAQQAMEKALKAALCALGRKVPLVHDLGALIAKLPDDDTRPFGYELIVYNDYAAIRRYEEGAEILTEKELKQALDQAKAVLEWAKSLIKSQLGPQK